MSDELTTLFTGRQCATLPEIDSTNTYLAGLLRNISLPEGAAVRTGKQHAGRGQTGSRWEGEPGKNLLVSFVFYPSFVAPKDVFIINKTFTLGVYDFISKWLGDHVTIKWPNDIYWKNKKVSGLLIENSINASTITYSILGIGININQRSFPAYLANPVSFALIAGREFNTEILYNSLCSFIEARYLQLKNGSLKKINDDYLSHLFCLGKWQMFSADQNDFKGRINGVDENGKIMIETEDGITKKFELKEVRFIQS